MSGSNISSVLSVHADGRFVVAQTMDVALAAALTRAELDRRGIERKQVEQ